VIVFLLYLFVYPVVMKPNPVALFEKFKSGFTPNLASVDTTSYSGGSYYEAVTLLEEGNYPNAAKLFEELVTSDSTYRSGSRWFLALINLRNGDKSSCKEQLKALEADDPAFYKKVAEKLFRKL